MNKNYLSTPRKLSTNVLMLLKSLRVFFKCDINGKCIF